MIVEEKGDRGGYKMHSLVKVGEIHYSNVLEFQKACVLYKSMLDKNFG